MHTAPKRWPKRDAAFWEEIPFFRILLPFISGIALYDAMPEAVSGWLIVGAIASLLLGLGILSQVRHFGSGYLLLRFAVFISFLALAGYGVAGIADIRNRTDWVGHQTDSSLRLLLRVTQEPKSTAKTWRLETEALAVLDTTTFRPASGGVLLTVFKSSAACPYQWGDTLLVANVLQLQNRPQYPFGFDSRRFYGRRNMHHQVLLPEREVLLSGRHAATQDGLIRRMNRWAMVTFDRNVTDPATRALLQAMLLGNETSFDPDLRKTYADTGVIHVVAISGSHLATLFLVFFFIPLLVRGVWGRRLQYSLGFIAVWTYVLLAGAPPSAIRAAVVFTLLAASILLDIRHHTINTLLAGVFFILCFRPMWLYEVGFQLSVLAVLSIVLLYPHVRKRVMVRQPVLRVLWNAVAVSFCAQVLVAPLSVYYFHNFPVWFLLSNLVAWLLVGIIALFGGIGVLLFAGAPALSRSIGDLTTVFVQAFNAFIRLMQALNPAAAQHLYLSLPELLLWYGLIGSVAIGCIHRRTWALFATGGFTMALLGISIASQLTAHQQDRLVVYPANQVSLADHLHGTRATPLLTVVPEDTLGGALKTVRTGYRAWRQRPVTVRNAVWRIAGKTVVLYTDSANRFAAPLPFPVDVLLVARPLKGLLPTVLQAAFRPKVLVVGGGNSRWRIQAWADSCAALHQPFHATPLHGAYVLE
ncbi:MAG: ComEC family competence protein [Sphingobacteriales bacterium]|nr:MAG: ComEC family competence protein [Sphingobacteriales bacterium]